MGFLLGSLQLPLTLCNFSFNQKSEIFKTFFNLVRLLNLIKNPISANIKAAGYEIQKNLPRGAAGFSGKDRRGSLPYPIIFIVKRGKYFIKKGTYFLCFFSRALSLDASFLVCLYYRQTLWDKYQKHVKVA